MNTKGCEYKSNVYSTFTSHRKQKHHLHSLVDFKDDLVQETCIAETVEPGVSNSEEIHAQSQFDEVALDTSKDESDLIQQKIASVLLKLETIFHVPTAAVDELLEEFQYFLESQQFTTWLPLFVIFDLSGLTLQV